MDKTVEKNINFYDLISPSFYELHDMIVNDTAPSNIWLKGGRGSGKTSATFLEVIDDIMQDPLANAVVFRRVGDSMRDSVLAEAQKAINRLGVEGKWRTTISPMRLIYRNDDGNEQAILFKGVDSADKVKGTSFPNGYAKWLIYEEADQFNNYSDFTTINNTLTRGAPKKARSVYMFNPPDHQYHWINEYVEEVRDLEEHYVLHSTFIPIALNHPEWLGETWLTTARTIRDTKPDRYKWEYLGQILPTGREVFPNAVFEPIKPEDIAHLESMQGFDEGYSKDPSVWLDVYFDERRDTVYIYDELFMVNYKTKALADDILEHQNGSGTLVRGDSANPRVLDELKDYGVNTYPVSKKPDSVPHGTKWLSDRAKIVINSEKCPNTWKEFRLYATVPNTGRKHGYPDKDNHSIDTCRYALEPVINAVKWLI